MFKSVKRVILKIASSWEIYLLLALSVFSTIDSYTNFSKNITPLDAVGYFQATLTYVISMLALLSLHLLRKDKNSLFSQVQTGAFENLPIEQAMQKARSGNKYFENVRILASTTANIQPMLMMNTDVKIKNCTVILSQSPNANSSLAIRVSTFVDAWMDNLQMKRIDNLAIKGYSHAPMFYLVILDEKALILGLFKENKNLKVAVEVGHPILIEGSSKESSLSIEKWIAWFDAYSQSIPIHRDFNSAKALVHESLALDVVTSNSIPVGVQIEDISPPRN